MKRKCYDSVCIVENCIHIDTQTERGVDSNEIINEGSLVWAAANLQFPKLNSSVLCTRFRTYGQWQSGRLCNIIRSADRLSVSPSFAYKLVAASHFLPYANGDFQFFHVLLANDEHKRNMTWHPRRTIQKQSRISLLGINQKPFHFSSLLFASECIRSTMDKIQMLSLYATG